MDKGLIPYNPPDDTSLELFHDTYMVPKDWSSCGPAIYITGAPGVHDSQPIAIALTNKSLSICGSNGPMWSLPLGAIQDVKVEELKGISFPINTPSGVVQMVPPVAYGLTLLFKLTPMGAVGRLQIFTLTLTAGHEWVNDIQTAVYNHSIDDKNLPDRR